MQIRQSTMKQRKSSLQSISIWTVIFNDRFVCLFLIRQLALQTNDSHIPKRTQDSTGSGASRKGIQSSAELKDGSTSNGKIYLKLPLVTPINGSSVIAHSDGVNTGDSAELNAEGMGEPGAPNADWNPLISSTQNTFDHAAYTRHPDWWLSDGSVIILVQRTLFHLHRTALSRKSEILHKRFEESDMDPKTQHLASVPVIAVGGDANDFALLLKAIDFGM